MHASAGIPAEAGAAAIAGTEVGIDMHVPPTNYSRFLALLEHAAVAQSEQHSEGNQQNSRGCPREGGATRQPHQA